MGERRHKWMKNGKWDWAQTMDGVEMSLEGERERAREKERKKKREKKR